VRRLRYIRLSGKQKAVAWIAIALVLLFMGAALIAVRIRPMVTRLAESRATNRVNRIVAEAVSDAVASGQVDCSRLITFEKDSGGKVTALRSNMPEFNRLQTLISDAVLERLSEMSPVDLSIPLGTLTGSNLLAGRGPYIHVRTQSVGTATAKLRNALTAAGINQTKHQVLLDVEVYVTVLLPGFATSVQVNNELCVAETVIVGNVPETYTYFSTTEDKVEDYADEYIMNKG
jgi:sporulation protein YunB